MTEPFLTVRRDDPVCHVRALHVEPSKGIADWRLEAAARREAEEGFAFGPADLVLIGSYPHLEHVRNDEARAHLEALVGEGRQVRGRPLQAPPDTHVSAVQVAAWFAQGRLMVASVGKNDVDAQRWGEHRAPLARCPGDSVGQLTTLWLPLTEGPGGSNLRWRVALAAAGPDPSRIDVAASSPAGGPPPTGHAATPGLSMSEFQLNVLVERFHEWLSFPAGTYIPKLRPVLKARAGEELPAGRPASRRSDTRLGRLDGVRDQLAIRTGHAGPVDLDFLRALIRHGSLRPAEVAEYPEVDLGLLDELGLLGPGAPRRSPESGP
jgi:hypothetical protein